MQRIRIEGDTPDLIAGFLAGVERVNDSAITIIDMDYSGRPAFILLEDQDGAGEDEDLRLTVNSIEPKD
jgi:hypothetical protein